MVARFLSLQVALTEAQQPECSCPGSVPRRRRGERGSSLPPPQPKPALTDHPGSGKKEEGGGAVRESTPPAALRKVLSSSTCVQQATRGFPSGRHAPFQSGNPRAPRRRGPPKHSQGTPNPVTRVSRVPVRRPGSVGSGWLACRNQACWRPEGGRRSPESGRWAAGAPVRCGPLTPGV